LIRPSAVDFVLGQLLLAPAATMLFPVAWSLVSGAGGGAPVAWAAAATAACGAAPLVCLRRPSKELNQREALLLVSLAWFAISAFGALPFLWAGHYAGYTDAFFEAASGFTTTGATVLSRVEVLAAPVQLWRHLTHWVGGMGIVLLGLAILPLVGHGGMALYRAEFSGAKSDRLKPRLAETALALWKLYVASRSRLPRSWPCGRRE
jgi:trk system potassium uptake protein TrkH